MEKAREIPLLPPNIVAFIFELRHQMLGPHFKEAPAINVIITKMYSYQNCHCHCPGFLFLEVPKKTLQLVLFINRWGYRSSAVK